MMLASPSSVSDLRRHFALHRKSSFFPTRARLVPHVSIIPRCSSSVQEIQKSSSPSEDRQLSSELYASAPFPPVKVAKRVVLVRHGQSTWNAEGRIQGSSNFSVLTKKGEAQAETSRQMLVDDKFDVCFASPLGRSKKTAEIIWEAREPQIITEYDLREIDLYSFQGLLKHEGKERFGPVYRQWQVDAANFNVDGHYPVRELWDRARGCWAKILAHDSRSILVVAHNAVNQALVATAIGLGTEYFRNLLQSNCGVSVLDFIPRSEGGSPHICLNRLNQTPGSPVTGGKSGGRKTNKQIILVCHGYTQGNAEDGFLLAGDQQLNMLGVIQSQKSAELLLDLKVNSIIRSPNKACIGTANAISQVQEAADCLGADCVPRYVEMKQMENLDVETIYQQSKDISNFAAIHPGWLNKIDDGVRTALWNQSGKAWQSLLEELSDEPSSSEVVVVVGHPAIHIALMGHCLNVTKEWLGSFHLDAGSVSVLDFPDGPKGRGTIRCINYTAHLGRWSIPITRSTEDNEEF
ncbi:probable 2-carboxy-D-arabinitol-1-phosphatase isoform X1 [Prosopis cineraria]|uniref:probable 2-carboxy-D-arabinitol-1-phosphatase isoform X1 n=1 Tax=Prosopis cineraria TaxID=364024 RepID=UPI00240F8A19|nr:probable 2-carboxy-D-arabinitol-1-phosphatase isoform X1 [Prosopis cineraria]